MKFLQSFPIYLNIAMLFSSAYATPESGYEGEELATGLTKRDEDCDFAKYFWADVDCSYTWSGGNYLYYKIYVEPTGQLNTDRRWCYSLISALVNTCGRSPTLGNAGYDWTICEDEKWLSYNLHHPRTGEVRMVPGLWFEMKYFWPWEPNEDATGCITEAIKQTLCAGNISFKNNMCYKHNT